MQKYTVLLTLILALAFSIACSPQVGDTVSEEETPASAPSGTEVDVQLGANEETETEAAEAEIVNESTESAVIEPVVPEPVGIQEPSDALLALLPDYDASAIQETASGLQYIIYEEGSGDTPVTGDTVIAHYTGYTADGNKFDSSRDRNATFDFRIGQGQVIRGWDEGFALMTPGTKALLIIPSDLGYGPSGAGADIPPNATLYFDVELVDIEPVRKPIQVEDSDFTDLDTGVRVHDFAIGDGAEAVDGKVTSLNFAVWDAGTTELFASSDENGQPIGFKLGSEQMFAALQDGVRGMQVGGSRQIYMPAETLEGAGFPPATDIVFEVELIDVTDGSPESPSEVDADAFVTLETGVSYADIVVGEGKPLVPGDFISMHYTAWLDDGTPFDSSIDRNAPLQFPVGQAPIPGFNEALVDMAAGGSRQIVVPADVIGDLGLPEPHDVIFDVQILDGALE